jgi:hypothetical protein
MWRTLQASGSRPMPRFLRYLRIAFSATCLIACVLLILLWVRSYDTADQLHGRFWGRQSFLLASKDGCFTAIAFRWHGAVNWWRWETSSYPVADYMGFPVGPVNQYVNSSGIGWLDRPLYVGPGVTPRPAGTGNGLYGVLMAKFNGAGPIVPYWFLVLLTGSCAVAPWISWSRRFSLRTLLIATTLIAVVLGAVVWATSG